MNGISATEAAPTRADRPRIADLLSSAQSADLRVTGIAADSREVRPGYLFLACAGLARTHGLDYLEQALLNGASAVAYEPQGRWAVATQELAAVPVPTIPVPGLRGEVGRIADRYFGAPSASLRVVGVTGTNGKTTVTWLLAAAAERLGMPTALLGTLGAGRPQALVAGDLTTPDAVAVQRFLAAARERDRDLDGVAMEVSSHALDQERVNGVRFEVGIFTNLSRDHLDYHADMDAYASAKARLFAEHRPRVAVINVDDQVGRRFVCGAAAQADRLYTIGRQAPPRQVAHGRHLQIEQIAQTHGGLRVQLGGEFAGATLTLPMLGAFNGYNALEVLAVLVDRQVPLDDAAAALAQCSAPPGRMQQVLGAGDSNAPVVVVDYSHTPDSLRASLTTLRAYVTGRLYCVFGCGGDRDRGKRPLMAQAAQECADQIIVTDDNPRHEDPVRIVDDIRSGFTAPHQVQVLHDRRSAIRAAIATAGAGDVVLIAGKGHEDYQLRADQRLSFSDYEEARLALRERGA